MKKITVLSLFDGISCAQVALRSLGYDPEYYASEIDKYALEITEKNYPKTIQVGDVTKLSVYNERLCLGDNKTGYFSKKIDLLIGGSPCQDLSIAKNNREGLDGKRSGLFWEYARILKEVKPKYFVLENVASMPKSAKEEITEALGVEPIMIDAKLVSAQQRKRLFWTNIKGVKQPDDRQIYLSDILESGEAVKEKAYCLTKSQKDFINDFIKRHQGNYVFKDKPIRIASMGKGGQADRIYSIHGKSVCLQAKGGGRGAKTGLYLITGGALRTYPRTKTEGVKRTKQLEIRKDGKSNSMTKVSTDSLVVLKDYFRPLTSVECERLQGLPDNFTEGVSKTRRKETLGNAFNVKVVKHILKNMKI